MVGGGDVAVALKDSTGAQALLTCLASTGVGEDLGRAGRLHLAQQERWTLPPTRTTSSPHDRPRRSIDAGDDVRFDMSDLTPQSFGGTPGRASGRRSRTSWRTRQDVAGTAGRAGADAATAYAA